MEIGRVPEGRTTREYAHTVIVRSNDPERSVVRLTVRDGCAIRHAAFTATRGTSGKERARKKEKRG